MPQDFEYYQNSILNLTTGAGTTGDSDSVYSLTPSLFANWDVLEVKSTSPIVQTILSKKLSWSCDQFSVIGKNATKASKLTTMIRKMVEVFKEAKRYELIYGGAAVIEHDGELVAIGCDELFPTDMITYSSYRYTGGLIGKDQEFDADEIWKMPGIPLTRRLRQLNQGWGGSYVSQILASCTAYEATLYALNRAIRKSNILVYGISGLSELVKSCDEKSAILLRQHIADVVASVERENILPVDADKSSVEFMSRSLNGLAENFTKCVDDVCLKADIPHSVLFGSRAKSGLGGDDDETANFHRSVDDSVEQCVLPGLEMMANRLRLLPNGYSIAYDALYSEDRKAVAEIEKINTESNLNRKSVVMELLDRGLITDKRALELLGVDPSERTNTDITEGTTLMLNSTQPREYLIESTKKWLSGDRDLPLLTDTEVLP